MSKDKLRLEQAKLAELQRKLRQHPGNSRATARLLPDPFHTRIEELEDLDDFLSEFT